MEKLLPQNIDAESGLLGSIIIDPDAITRIDGEIQARDFYRDAHRTLFGVIVDLYREREPADFIMICDELERRGQLEEIGGASYITSLIGQVPTSGNVKYYAGIIAQASQQRQLIHAAGNIAAVAYERDPDALAKAEEIIFKLSSQAGQGSDFVGGETLVSEALANLERLNKHRGTVIGVPTGFSTLDRCLGGLQKSDLILLAARPGLGKTSLALSMANNALTSGYRVAIFSLEMSREQLTQKLLAMNTGIDTQKLRNGRFEKGDWDRLVNAGDAIAASQIWIDHTPAITISELRSKARRLQADQGLDLIVVDYLQLMHANRNGKRVEDRLQEISEISAGLKAVAKELNVPVLALAQLSREVEKRGNKIPQLSDLRESGTLEQDADIVLFIYRDDVYAENEGKRSEPTGEANIIVGKHRNGPTGEANLYFHASTTRFFNDHNEMVLAYAKQ